MKTKKNILRIISLLVVAATIISYSCSGGSKSKDDKITLTTNIEVGEQIYLVINADEENRENVWIDLNGNGKKDEGEYEIDFGERQEFEVESQTITVYGKVTRFTCFSMRVSELDVTHSPDLLDLSCGQNAISKLDVSKNTKLKELMCHSNKLTSLDLSNNTALRKMNISGNNMEKLKVKELPELQYMELHKNSLSKETLTSLFNAFPTRNDIGRGSTGSVILTEPLAGDRENNEITPELIQLLKDKNWRPLKRERGNVDL